jgi:hypothetical protein
VVVDRLPWWVGKVVDATPASIALRGEAEGRADIFARRGIDAANLEQSDAFVNVGGDSIWVKQCGGKVVADNELVGAGIA